MLRTVRKRIEAEMHYGHVMAINIAIGLLHLGGGRYKERAVFKDEAFTLACFLGAFFPVWPRDPADNRYHLQALREMWIMAVQRDNVKSIVTQVAPKEPVEAF